MCVLILSQFVEVVCHKEAGWLVDLQAVNYGSTPLNLHLTVSGLSTNCVSVADSIMMLMTSGGLMDENSFANPTKVSIYQTTSISLLSFVTKIS